MRTGRKTDKGFTLIELIVVIAIIAVLTGVFLISINPIQATAAKQAATNTMDALLKGKQYAMTRGNTGTFMQISQDDKELTVKYYVNDTAVDSEVITSRKVSIRYNDGTMGSDWIVGDSYGDNGQLVHNGDLWIGFDKGSGACNRFSNQRTGTTAASVEKYIRISAGGRTYKITVSGLTGRVDMVRE